MCVVPCRVFGSVARQETFPPRGVLSEFAARSEFRTARSSARIGLDAPALPLAIPSAVRFSFDRLHRSQLSDRRALSASSAFLQSLDQRSLVRQPQPADSSLGLSLPTAHARPGGPLSAGAATARYVPPSGFGYPRDGLRPPGPGRFCFTPAALLGFALRSFRLTKGTRRVSAGMHPLAVPHRRLSRRRSDGPAQRAAASGF